MLDQDAERLFVKNGAASSDDPNQMAITRFIDDLRQAYTSAPDPATRAAHIEAIVRAYREAGIHTGYPNGTKVKRGRRRLVLRGSVAAAALVLAGGSAMAATGALPDAAQDVVARAAKRIGISIPKGDDAVSVVRREADRGVEITRVKARPTIKKTTPAKVRSDTDIDDNDGSDDDGGGVSTIARRPSNDSPPRPKRPTEPDPVDDDSDPDPIGGGSADGRGDPSGGGSGGEEPDEPDEPGDGGGGRGDPIDGSDGDSEEPSEPDGGGGAGGSDAGGGGGGGAGGGGGSP